MIELSQRLGRIMIPRTRLRALALEALFRLLALHHGARDYFAEMKFKPKPRFHHGFLFDQAGARNRRSLVGRLFPQALVATAIGYQLLDDLLGAGFALLAPPGTPPHLLEQSTANDASPLRRVVVLDREDASPIDPRIIGARDLRGDLAHLLRGHPPGLFVLRPDRYVCAFFPPEQVRSIPDALARLSAATWRRTAGEAAA